MASRQHSSRAESFLRPRRHLGNSIAVFSAIDASQNRYRGSEPMPERRGEDRDGGMLRFALIRLDGAVPAVGPIRVNRRKITPGAGKALEILAHALEYLSDECAVNGAAEASLRARMEAIELLKALNRGIYFGCPEVPTASSRCRAFFRRCFG